MPRRVNPERIKRVAFARRLIANLTPWGHANKLIRRQFAIGVRQANRYLAEARDQLKYDHDERDVASDRESLVDLLRGMLKESLEAVEPMKLRESKPIEFVDSDGKVSVRTESLETIKMVPKKDLRSALEATRQMALLLGLNVATKQELKHNVSVLEDELRGCTDEELLERAKKAGIGITANYALYSSRAPSAKEADPTVSNGNGTVHES